MSRQVLRIASTEDPRLTNLQEIGGGEGFETYTGEFEGKTAFIVDCGTMLDFDFDDDEEEEDDAVSVHVFATEGERDAFIDDMRRNNPGALGIRPGFGDRLT